MEYKTLEWIESMMAQFFVVFVGSNYPRIYISNRNKNFEIVLTHLTETEIRRIVEMSSLQANKQKPHNLQILVPINLNDSTVACWEHKIPKWKVIDFLTDKSNMYTKRWNVARQYLFDDFIIFFFFSSKRWFSMWMIICNNMYFYSKKLYEVNE